jgi:Tfp pilus assembly protein PilN
MRAVNLIPVEERRGDSAPTRTGGLVYVILGALLAALAGVSMMVVAGNQVSESKADVASLRVEESEARGEAEALASYIAFQGVRDARVATVTALADSRFDWERVMRELSLVLPEDIWLIQLTATARPDIDIENGIDIALRDSASGPALEIKGCATSHEAVGGFISALRDIDGVTRVGVSTSARPELSSEASDGSGDESDCRTRDFITMFEVVAAFDAAPVQPPAVSPDGAAPVPAPAPEAPAAEATPTASSGG